MNRNGKSYRGITKTTAEWIGMAASAAGGYVAMKEAARVHLGQLFDYADYPSNIWDEFGVDWSLENVQAPDYLLELRPDLYDREAARVREQFEQAARMAEESFVEEFGKLVRHLQERLLPDPETGKPKTFRDSTIGNLRDFFERFRDLNVTNNATLEALVDQAQTIVADTKPGALRDSSALRSSTRQAFSGIEKSLDELIVDQPRRRVMRKKK